MKQNENIKQLAADIEQFMFEHGEYDFGSGDRKPWLDEVPDAYELANSGPILLGVARERVEDCIEQSINGTAPEEIGGIESLMEYLNEELNVMDEEDELIQTGENLLSRLNKVLNQQEKQEKETSRQDYDIPR